VLALMPAGDESDELISTDVVLAEDMELGVGKE
jgi:hypothetical protein